MKGQPKLPPKKGWPEVSEKLIENLRIAFPDKLVSPFMKSGENVVAKDSSAYALDSAAAYGQQQIIQFLTAVYNAQQGNAEDES